MYVFERLSDEFTFGKYRGYSFSDIVELDGSYIYWCMDTFPDRFIIFDEAIRELIILYPQFRITPCFEAVRVQCLKDYLQINDDLYIDDTNFDDGICFEKEPETFDRYNGSYAQDIENCSDQFIEDVLDGDPNAYWNID